ncbi:hypothetical protein GCM10008910_23780 [Faecalicatena orotica]|uniref:Uncharacterized protein n=1 Tax=Faecalicatena orotica TaxID=1544 RepID=A0A2Y9BFV5_9FIRM|nr:hypothetical protein [Faecalicatena orotica]PWJ28379.1 hypothetical protein A8806_109263 [Faecalicatena orotica]SSA56835.1 hypothetical protein SAMN05216536_109263 [Faecalicatena orotica]
MSLINDDLLAISKLLGTKLGHIRSNMVAKQDLSNCLERMGHKVNQRIDDIAARVERLEQVS